jgi:hypothetical protein
MMFSSSVGFFLVSATVGDQSTTLHVGRLAEDEERVPKQTRVCKKI